MKAAIDSPELLVTDVKVPEAFQAPQRSTLASSAYAKAVTLNESPEGAGAPALLDWVELLGKASKGQLDSVRSRLISRLPQK